jgi:hypothetical protein
MPGMQEWQRGREMSHFKVMFTMARDIYQDWFELLLKEWQFQW